ncbi:uncharacterized protein N7515_001059 [Penicillium bovifimosum]|uniref:Uncharacterized protein n=1 Tax=Penicillium bovifimosum TaxID=126998 RepID=A0A9W9HGJ1_9EURO|nr:uncharacterized protein N7515_001059 [Penicillium bovifimosum]KAJ5146495.1 hypothetical protein N7515_001059 [Penicillium bovifimosum]
MRGRFRWTPVKLGGVVEQGHARPARNHKRSTTDVDILIRSQTVFDSLGSVEGFEVIEGRLSYREVIVDLLTTIDDRFTYNQVDGYARHVEGVRMLRFDFALAVKIRCSYLRSDDSNGLEKQQTDLLDVVFLAKATRKAGQTILDSCAALFQVGCYHAVLVRLQLRFNDFKVLADVGFGRLVIPWANH